MKFFNKLAKPKKSLNELFDDVKRIEKEVTAAQNDVLSCKVGLNGLSKNDLSKYEKILDKKWKEYHEAVAAYNNYDNDPTNDYMSMLKRIK